MAVKKYFANADTTITNAFRSNLTQRGTDANMGASDILETFSIYGQAQSGSTELERLLIKFPISEIVADRAQSQLPPSGSVSFYLKMYNAPHNETIPREMTLDIYAVSRSWQEGTGLDMEEYLDVVYPGNVGSTWMAANGTTNWNCPGGDYHASPKYSAFFDRGYENLKVDVTPLIEEWIAGTKENYGFGIHLTATQEAYYALYSPREAVYFDQLSILSGSGVETLTASAGSDTLCMWLYYNAGPIQNFAAWNTGITTINRALDILPGGEFNQYRAYSGGGYGTAQTTQQLTEKTWYHIAITEDGADPNSLPTLYVNGLSQSVTFPIGTITGTATPAGPFSLGGRPVPLVDNFSGNLDDIAYYDRELTAPEILEIYNNGCPNNLKEIQSSKASLKNWWINGDDPRDAIHLGTPPTEISIYDQVGTFDLYASGTGSMAIVESICAGGAPCKEGVFSGSAPPAAGQVINLDGAQTSYYTKKFFGRGTEFYYKRPSIEATWDSSIKDDRGRLHLSSSLLPVEDNTYTLYLYNVFGGRLRDIPSVGTGEIYMQFYSSTTASIPFFPTPVTGGWVSTGIYSASFELSGALFEAESNSDLVVCDRWFSAGTQPDDHWKPAAGNNVIQTNRCPPFSIYTLPTYTPFSPIAPMHPGNLQYVTTITNLKASYTPTDNVRLRLFTRLKNWSPTIYTVANERIESSIIVSASYEVYRVVDDLKVLPYGTGSDNCTMMSYDIAGNYFDLDMGYFEKGYSYGIRVAFYDENSWVEQPYTWKFRVDELDEY